MHIIKKFKRVTKKLMHIHKFTKFCEAGVPIGGLINK